MLAHKDNGKHYFVRRWKLVNNFSYPLSSHFFFIVVESITTLSYCYRALDDN